MKKGTYQFKDVELAFNFKKLPACDQEYLRTMFYQTLGDRSVKNTGISFHEYYPGAASFTLFNDKHVKDLTMWEYTRPSAGTASHLLHGKKYYLAWTYDRDKANELVTI
tara:strand:- start:10 stop:336 length:327 start_codon:yes stop_codon:yes gene_type:complete